MMQSIGKGGDNMAEITIYTNDPWITKMVVDGEVLDYEEAQDYFNYICSELNATQYPEE